MKSKITGLIIISLWILLNSTVVQSALPVYSEQEINNFIQKQKQVAAAREQKAAAMNQSMKAVAQTSLDHRQQALEQRAKITPQKEQQPSSKIKPCDCYDPTNAYNYKGNFLYDEQGNRSQRKLPTPCKCLKAPSNGHAIPMTNGKTTKQTDQSPSSNGWNIQY